MKALVIDIETINCTNPDHLAYLQNSVKPDSRLKDPEKVAADIAAKQAEVQSKTGLSGDFGMICVIGANLISDDVGLGVIQFHAPESLSPLEVEAKALRNFMTWMANTYTTSSPEIVGHNLLWDLRFIAKRCVVHGISIHPALIHALTRRDSGVDTMTAWAGWGERVKLETICVALGIPSPKGEMDGSMVNEYWTTGRRADVLHYNEQDLIATGRVFSAMRKAGLV